MSPVPIEHLAPDAEPLRVVELLARDGCCVVDRLALRETLAALEGATNFQIHLTQGIAIGPGEPSQLVHRGQRAFDFVPFPRGYEVQCNTIWAVSDFTEQSGATSLGDLSAANERARGSIR